MIEKPQPGHEAVITAEYRLLNALVRDKAFRTDSRIHGGLFVHETARSVFQAIQRLDTEEIEISTASLLQAGNAIDYTVAAPVIDTIFELGETAPAKLDDVLKTLNTAQQKLQLRDKFSKLASMASHTGDLDIGEVYKQLFDVDSLLKEGGTTSLLKSFACWSEEYIADLEQRSNGKRFSYGDVSLDKTLLKGAYPGAITTFAAATGQGKSTFVLNLVNSLLEMQVPCMYVSLEMSGVDTYDRLISMRRGIPMEDLYAYDDRLLSIADVVREEMEALKGNNRFYFVEEPGLSIARLKPLIKEFKQRTRSDYAVVFIDLATQLEDFMKTKGNSSVANSMELAMNSLNALAKELNIHFGLVAQFNREADNYKISTVDDLDNLRPTLGQIKNSNAIAERSRVVLGLFRKRYYVEKYLQDDSDAMALPDQLDVQVLKNSSGPSGEIIKYSFEGQFFRVTPLIEAEPTIPITF
jgi:replicative DNA helicase